MEKNPNMRHSISVLVNNRPGVLTRVAGLFARRGFNIESLSVNITQDPEISRMTIVVGGNETQLQHIVRQLYKLIDVNTVRDHIGEAVVERELGLVRLNAPLESRAGIFQICDVFRASIVDLGEDNMIVEVTGTEEKIDAFTRLLKPFGIVEMVRTGKILLPRGGQNSKP